MPASGVTRANENRALRQEALREQLSQQKHVEHVVVLAEKLTDPEEKLEPLMVRRLEIAINTRLRLVSKYMPDLKSIEYQGETQTGLAELLTQAAQRAHELREQDKHKVIDAEVVKEAEKGSESVTETEETKTESLMDLVKQAEMT